MRGQAHTLEAFVASLVLLSGVVFALQATAVTPLTASTSNQHIENQQRAVAENLLAASAANGTLKPSVLHWNTSRSGDGAFEGSSRRGVYHSGGPPTPFGSDLDETFGSDRIAFNVDVFHRSPDGSRNRRSMVQMGEPSDNAVSASRAVIVFDDDRLSTTGERVFEANSTSDFYAEDVQPDGELFNVMEVRIVVWRI